MFDISPSCVKLQHLVQTEGRIRTLLLYPKDGYGSKAECNVIVSNCPVLRALDITSGKLENLTTSIGKLIHLRCLFLYKVELKTLPDSIGELINLTHLGLISCPSLTHLPSEISGLSSLEVLDLQDCIKLAKLPSGIENWSSLRQLNLLGCRSLTHLPSGIEKLVNLRHLNLEFCWNLARFPLGMGALLPVCTPCMFIVGDPKFEHTAQLEEIGPLTDLHAEMIIKLHDNIPVKSPGDEEAFLLNKKKLRQLEIEYQANQEAEVTNNHREVLGKLQPSNHLEEFILRRYQDTMFPTWMTERGFASVLPNLVTLEFVDCMKCQYLPPLSGLVCLRELRLCWLSSLEYIEGGGNVSEAQFGLPKLERLTLEDLPKLKAWCIVNDNNDYKHDRPLMLPASFPRLSDLDISGCSALTNPTLLSFLQPFQLNRDSSRKTQDTSSSQPFHLFAQVCINSVFLLSKEEDSLELSLM